MTAKSKTQNKIVQRNVKLQIVVKLDRNSANLKFYRTNCCNLRKFTVDNAIKQFEMRLKKRLLLQLTSLKSSTVSVCFVATNEQFFTQNCKSELQNEENYNENNIN